MSILKKAMNLFNQSPDHIKRHVESIGRIGRQPNLAQEGTLDMMVAEGYHMIGMDYYNIQPPQQMIDFALFILQEKEGMSLPEPLSEELSELMAKMALRYVDSWDPRFILYYSDVTDTRDWMTRTYQIVNASPYCFDTLPFTVTQDCVHELETYQVVPGRDESYFNEFYDMPQFRYTMFMAQDEIVTDYFRDFINCGDMSGYLQEFSEEALEQFADIFINEKGHYKDLVDDAGRKFKRQCYTTGSREDDVTIIEHICEVLVCAHLVWFCSPMAKRFRSDINEICYLAEQYPEFIAYERCFYTPDSYVYQDRPVTSCHLCGLDAYCVEITHGIEGESLQICNGCLSKNRPPLPQATCGTKFCKHIECHHNKYNGMGEKGRYAMDAESPTSYLNYKRAMSGAQHRVPKGFQQLTSEANAKRLAITQ